MTGMNLSIANVRSECVNEALHRLLKPLLEQAVD